MSRTIKGYSGLAHEHYVYRYTSIYACCMYASTSGANSVGWLTSFNDDDVRMAECDIGAGLSTTTYGM